MDSFLTIIGLIVVLFSIASVVVVIIVMIFGRSEKVVKPEHYVLGNEWTFGPVLYSALDIAPLGASAHTSYDEAQDFIGGSAHGKW